jgi:hypothetical protein
MALSPEQLSRAKARARAAGRPYPNAFDNMVAGGAKWREGVHKASEELQMPYWYQMGIPSTRSQSDPISPLAMYASSRIMVDNAAALLGRNLSRREKKAAGKNAYQFTAARGLAYAPLEMLG